jgi:hypothetical protein
MPGRRAALSWNSWDLSRLCIWWVHDGARPCWLNLGVNYNNIIKFCQQAQNDKFVVSLLIQPQKPFECLLLWTPRETAEQLSIIENTLFSRIGNRCGMHKQTNIPYLNLDNCGGSIHSPFPTPSFVTFKMLASLPRGRRLPALSAGGGAWNSEARGEL